LASQWRVYIENSPMVAVDLLPFDMSLKI